MSNKNKPNRTQSKLIDRMKRASKGMVHDSVKNVEPGMWAPPASLKNAVARVISTEFDEGNQQEPLVKINCVVLEDAKDTGETTLAGKMFTIRHSLSAFQSDNYSRTYKEAVQDLYKDLKKMGLTDQVTSASCETEVVMDVVPILDQNKPLVLFGTGKKFKEVYGARPYITGLIEDEAYDPPSSDPDQKINSELDQYQVDTKWAMEVEGSDDMLIVMILDVDEEKQTATVRNTETKKILDEPVPFSDLLDLSGYIDLDDDEGSEDSDDQFETVS